MGDESKEVRYDITGDASGFVKSMEQSAAAVGTATKQIDAQFKSLGDTFGAVQKQMLAFTAVLAGGGALKKFIDDANAWNTEAAKMAKTLGVTTEAASVLNVALKHIGVDSDTYISASEKLSKNIQGNAQAFEVLGVKVQEANGQYRPVVQVMADVNDKLAAIKNPIEQNIAGQQAYGKGWSEVRAILKLTTSGMEEAEKRARDLGLIVGPEGAAMSKKYTEQMRDLNLVGKSLEVQFGNVLLPVFTNLGSVISQNVTPVVKVMATVLETVVVIGRNVSFVFTQMAKDIAASAQAFILMQKWDFAGAKAMLDGRAAEAAQARSMLDMLDAQTLGGGGAGAGRGLINPAGASAPGPHYKFKEKAETKGGGGESRMGLWEAQLAEQKLAFQEQENAAGTFHKFSHAQEADYWRAMLALAVKGTAENIPVRKKLAEVQLTINKEVFAAEVAGLHTQAAEWKNNSDNKLAILARESELMRQRYGQQSKEYEEVQKRIVEAKRMAAEQLLQIEAISLQRIRAAQQSELMIKEEASRLDLALGLIDQAQMLAMQQQFEAQRFAISRQALQDKLALMARDPDRSPVELARINAEIAQLEQQHQQRLAQIRTQASTESARNITSTLGNIQAGWGRLIQQLAQGTLSIGGFIKGIFSTVASAVVQTLAAMAAKWMVQKVAMMIFGKTLGLSEIATQSALAGAGGVASMAAAPFPTNLTAPFFGAAMAAAALAFAPAASASQGFDIPSGVNPVTQLHAREMVLPDKHADVIRALADGRSMPGASASGDLHVTVRGQSAGDFFMLHKADLVKAMQSARKDLRF